MELWVGAFNLGFLYAFMAMGVFITFRVYNFPDVTVDGSFTTGAAIAAVLLVEKVNPFLALVASFFVGGIAGCLTGFIHTRFNINGLLAGILVMTGLYSINLHLMGRSNIPLIHQNHLITFLEAIQPGLPKEVWLCLCFFGVMILFWVIVALFFKTDLGITMRTTGNNPTMASASGVNVNGIKIFGIAIANGLVGVSGGLVAQYQGFADIGMGIGTIVFGLAAVIIGESVLRPQSVSMKILCVILGSVVFRLMIALALYIGLNPIDLKLITAAFVLLVLITPHMFTGKGFKISKMADRIYHVINGRRLVTGVCIAAFLLVVVIIGYKEIRFPAPTSSKMVRIGIVQVSDHPLLNITRDSFLEEMRKLGYESEKNCFFSLGNANGDLPTISSILDKFIQDRVDIIVPISTACTQAAINKIKDRPIVFATVANPFIIGAGNSDTDHLSNVTGVYGAAPADKMMEVVTQILSGNLKVGVIWDPAHENSVFNVNQLKRVLSQYKNVTFVGATITNSSEVYQAAVSLVTKGIDAFVLTPDNIVYSAFESVVKAAQPKKIPIFISDVERLKDGALAAYGYDYTSSGIQAAHLVTRVLKGEKPAHIPFEKYQKLTFGLNLDVAKEIGMTLPPDLVAKATLIGGDMAKGTSPKRLALFLFSHNLILQISAQGLMDELKRSGMLEKYRITVDEKNAQNDYAMANAIVQDIIRRKYDYIVTISTQALQVTANANKTIPHIFGGVTDPFLAGAAKDPYLHPPNLTGIGTFQPVESTIRAMREIFSKAKRIGIIWNPAEVNSEACIIKARPAAKEYHFELLEQTVNSTGEVKDALTALLNKKIDLFFTSGDSTVTLALETVAEILRQHKIPYFTNSPSDVEHGAFFSIGADYYEVGVETAKMAQRVIEGENPKDIPIKEFVPEKIGINLSLAKLYGITIPDSILKKAAIVKR